MKTGDSIEGHDAQRKIVGALGTMNLITILGLMSRGQAVLGTGINRATGLSHVTRTRGHVRRHGIS